MNEEVRRESWSNSHVGGKRISISKNFLSSLCCANCPCKPQKRRNLMGWNMSYPRYQPKFVRQCGGASHLGTPRTIENSRLSNTKNAVNGF